MTDTLSDRQLQVLHLIARGATDAQIARRLDIGITTAYRHVTDIRNKLGAANRAQAVAVAFQRGILRTAASR